MIDCSVVTLYFSDGSYQSGTYCARTEEDTSAGGETIHTLSGPLQEYAASITTAIPFLLP